MSTATTDFRPRQRRKKSPPWLWMTAGLTVGLLVAFLVFLQMRPKQAAPTPRAALSVPTEQAARPKPEPRPAPEPPPKPRFDFYNLLPAMEVVVPDEEIQGAPTQEGVKQVEQPGTYLLQAGSFRSAPQAEQLRAKLGLLGLETSTQAIKGGSGETWHRVRVGPFSNLRDLNEARTQLRKNGVDAILIRLKG